MNNTTDELIQELHTARREARLEAERLRALLREIERILRNGLK